MDAYLRLKAELLVEGVSADRESLSGLGTRYKEQNHGLFGWDFEDHQGTLLPDDFCLPDGTIVQFRQNSSSQLHIRTVDGTRTLFRAEDPICAVQWLRRPDFYSRTTEADVPMVRIGQIGGEDCLFFCYQNYCAHFGRNKQCLFCNLVSTTHTYDSVLKKKEIEAIAHVAGTAWKEGMVRHVLLTGGCFNQGAETELVSNIVSAISRQTGFQKVPGTVLPSPAKGDAIRRYYDSGIQAIGYSMEIWDEKLYTAICPGKSESTSHREFLDSIETAVDVFGPGNVFGVFVLGLEPQDTFLEGVKFLSQTGANTVPFVWSPNPGSRLSGHRAPRADWYLDVMYKAADIVREAGVPSGSENHCYRCDGNSLLHDALRLSEER